MTLTELRYLLAVAETKHFGRAAKISHVSQPTLSIAIKKLEQRLGIDIFERLRHDIQITDIGEKIITQAKRIIEEADLMQQIISHQDTQTSTALKLGAIYTVAPYIFPSIIPALRASTPNMPLIIHDDFTHSLTSKLQRGQLDAILIALPFNVPNIVTRPLYEESFVVLLPKQHPLSKKKALSATDLKKENTLLLGEGHCFRDQVIQACPQCYQPNSFQQTVEGTSLETIRHMVASGNGITILPSTAVNMRYYADTLCIRPFKSKAPRRTIALAWRNSFPRPKAIEAIIQALASTKISNMCFIA